MAGETRFVVVTGLSGAGKSQATHHLEDLGYFCVDNLPPALIPKFAELCAQAQDRMNRVAVVVDVRGGEFFNDLFKALEWLEERGFPYQILFLEASDEVLVKRYKESRRRHPLDPTARVLDAIQEERRRLQEVRGRAHIILDTSHLSVSDLREKIRALFGADGAGSGFTVNVVTFGFKHGLPVDADLVFDVRFLPNPHYVESLRRRTGNDAQVAEYVLRWPITQRVLERLSGLVDFLLPYYQAEGRSQLVVAIGCTGGQHRSVVIGNQLAAALRAAGRQVVVEHRDIDKGCDEEGKA